MLTQRLILEGENDKHVIANLLDVLKIPNPIDYEIEEVFWKDFLKVERREGGKDAALKMLQKTLKERNALDNLGIIIDADESVARTWQSIRDILLRNGFLDEIVPRKPLSTGTIIGQEGQPKIGIWIMPDNLRPDDIESKAHFYLEHFYQDFIRTDDVLLKKAAEFVQYIQENHDREDYDSRFRDVQLQKAIIHTWLSWLDEPGEAMGRTLKKERLFDFNNALLQQFLTWYKMTFRLST
jgi:hypothetical protein